MPQLGVESTSGEKRKFLSIISADGKYLFFQAAPPFIEEWAHDRTYTLPELLRKELLMPTAYDLDIYWVETKVVEALRPKGDR